MIFFLKLLPSSSIIGNNFKISMYLNINKQFIFSISPYQNSVSLNDATLHLKIEFNYLCVHVLMKQKVTWGSLFSLQMPVWLCTSCFLKFSLVSLFYIQMMALIGATSGKSSFLETSLFAFFSSAGISSGL